MLNYKSKLVKEMNGFTKKFILLFLLFFTLILLLTTFIIQEVNVKKITKEYTVILDNVFHNFEDHLEFNQNNQNFVSFITDQQNIEDVYQSYYRFRSTSFIDCHMILTDMNGNVLFESEHNTLELDYKKLRNELISLENSEYVTSVVRTKNGMTHLVLTTTVISNNDVIGYISYYYDTTSFHYELSIMQYHGAIIDRFGNVLASSSPSFISGYLKRLDTGFDHNGYVKRNGSLFRVETKEYKENIQIVAIVSLSDYLTIYQFGFIFILLFGVASYFISKRYVYLLADNNSASIAKLVEQMEIIKKGDFDHRIVLDTEDEFEMLSEDINIMVTVVEKIASRNAELYYMNKVSEMKQLEAQFNPHFMYNTLETIRYSILFDREIANDLILKLTTILRYSIDNEEKKVYFIDDLEIINQYLDIQKYRYKDRLTVVFDISKECEMRRIPRLMIQPLIENSLQNGFRHRTNLIIKVKAFIENEIMSVIVEDNGNGIDPKELDRINENLLAPYNKTKHNGLFNINRRIYLMYGPGSHLHLESELTKGTKACIIINLKGM